MGDAPGPGQDLAVRAIEVAERLVQKGNTITIRWKSAHVGVEGNERADLAAKSAATLPSLRGTQGRLSLAFLKRRITEGACRRWIEDTKIRMERKEGGRGAFVGPDKRARPRIRAPLRRTRQGVAARYFQLLSGHAMIAPFSRTGGGGRTRMLVGGAMVGDRAEIICSRSVRGGEGRSRSYGMKQGRYRAEGRRGIALSRAERDLVFM